MIKKFSVLRALVLFSVSVSASVCLASGTGGKMSGLQTIDEGSEPEVISPPGAPRMSTRRLAIAQLQAPQVTDDNKPFPELSIEELSRALATLAKFNESVSPKTNSSSNNCK